MLPLPEIENQMQGFLDSAQISIMRYCQHVAMIAEDRLWQQENYPSFRAYMLKRWSIGKTQAYEMWRIGRNVNNSAITENLPITQLQALANVKPEYRAATLSALQILPDKLTAAAINRLADVVETAAITGAIEIEPGEQIPLDQLDALESGYLLETIEAQKRQLQHTHDNKPKPFLSLSGLTLREAVNFNNINKYDPDLPVAVEYRESSAGLTINVRFMKVGEKV